MQVSLPLSWLQLLPYEGGLPCAAQEGFLLEVTFAWFVLSTLLHSQRWSQTMNGTPTNICIIKIWYMVPTQDSIMQSTKMYINVQKKIYLVS